MTGSLKKDYATKAKFEHALRMAELAGITVVGSIELGPDGTIRIERAAPTDGAPPSVEDEIAKWRERKRGK
jgi:hypothetical protein